MARRSPQRQRRGRGPTRPKVLIPVAIALALLAALYLLSPRESPEATLQKRAAAGEKLFVARGCNICHGDRAQGDVGLPLGGVSRERVVQMVRSGGGGMPAFTQRQVSDPDLEAMAAWFSTLRPMGGNQTPSPAR